MLSWMSSLDHATVGGAPVAPAVPVAANAWMRKPRRTNTFAALAYVNAAAWVAMGADVATQSRFTSDTVTLVVALVFLLGVAALSVIAGVRIAGCGLWMSADEVRVKGPLRSWTLSVDEVEGFEPGVSGAGKGTPCPLLKRTHGQPIGVWGLGDEGLFTGNRDSLAALRPLCDELNELLRTLTAARQPTAGE